MKSPPLNTNETQDQKEDRKEDGSGNPLADASASARFNAEVNALRSRQPAKTNRVVEFLKNSTRGIIVPT